jgi:mono/diheme cytochrome c family protein
MYLLLFLALSVSAATIPRAWDDAEMARVELPLASGLKVQHVPASFYYRIPVRPNVKTYPIYAPGREPAGYFQWLKQLDPQPAFDPGTLRTQEDWIRAGEVVFESARQFTAADDPFTDVRNPLWYSETGIPIDKNGVLPFYRYVIRQRGKVEVTMDSCASCHTRLMPDGSIVKGAQGNIPFGRTYAYALTHNPRSDANRPAKRALLRFFGAPWIQPDPMEPLASKSIAHFAAHLRTIPPGVSPRQGTSALFPAQIPDLIGIKDVIYFDHTGLQHHRSIGDLMRYAAINNFIEEIADYAGFRPITASSRLPEPEHLSRASDSELFALAVYLYSLKPPPNPNKPGQLSRKGEAVFQRAGCAACHTPPLYTSNMLTPVQGFDVPEAHRQAYRILDVVVGTDPFLALRTRRGTGYYKVPSLRGVWRRGPFEHNGSVAKLEDWFDPNRLRENYTPTGYRGYGTETRAVPGHEYGLDLPDRDKKALIAFLKTL